MSQENVEVVRDSVRAFAEGGLAAMAQFWAAEIDWRAMEGAPDDVGEIRGVEALRDYYQDWLRDKQLASAEFYANRAEALEAAGLRE